MKLKRLGVSAAVLTIAAASLAACGQSNNPGQQSGGSESQSSGQEVSGTLSGSGATSQEAAISAWQSGLQSSQPKLNVQYNGVGSGSGRKAFLAGQAQFAGSDAAMDSDEQTQAKKVCGDDGAINVPVYVSPVSIAFNLKGVDKLQLDADTIAKIFSGEIKKWNDPAIAKQNDGVDLPSTAITPVHRSDSSGTTKNFTDYLAAAAKDSWKPGVVEDWPSNLGGESAQGTSGVVKLVGSTDGAITYADLSAAKDLGKVAVKVGDEYQEPTEEAAAKTVELSKRVAGEGSKDLALKVDRTSTEAGTYPVILVSYDIFCTSYKDQNTVDMVKAWGTYVTSEEGQKAAEEAAGSAPLSSKMQEDAKASIDSITVSGK